MFGDAHSNERSEVAFLVATFRRSHHSEVIRREKRAEDGRKFDIRFLLEHILPKGMFTPIEESTLTYNGGFAMWRKSHFDNIKAISAELTPANVMKWNGPIGQLKKAIINPLGVDALFVTEFYDGAGTAERSADLMDIIARLKKGDRLYIGAILGYHN